MDQARHIAGDTGGHSAQAEDCCALAALAVGFAGLGVANTAAAGASGIGSAVSTGVTMSQVLAAANLAASPVVTGTVIPTADPRPEYLMPVEPGRSLGRNGRYAEYLYRDNAAWNWASPTCSSTASEEGRIRLVSACTPGKLFTTVIDPVGYTAVSRKEVNLTQALPIIGTVEIMADGFIYVLSGQDNLEERDDREVMRVSKFTTDLEHKGSAGIASGDISEFGDRATEGVTVPFNAGSPDLALVGDVLYAHASRRMYKSNSDGLNHQANVTLELNTKAMTGLVQKTFAYTSHSFNQFIGEVAGNLVLVDHGDAFPREVRLAQVTPATSMPRGPYTLLNIHGETGDNFTGVTIGGLGISGTVAAIAATSTPHDKAVTGKTGVLANAAGQFDSNVYFSAVDLASGKQTFVWLTDNDPETSATMVGQAAITALASDEFVVMFHTTRKAGDQFKRTLEYRLVSPTGQIRATKTFADLAWLPSSDPVVIGNKMFWIGAPQRTSGIGVVDGDGGENYLSGIDLTSPSAPKLLALSLKPFAAAPMPTISGSPTAGSTLTAKVGAWSPGATSLTYQWRLDSVPIPGATSKTFKIPPTAAGHDLDVVVRGSAAGYLPTTRVSATLRARALFITGPTITGSERAGSLLTASPGAWSPAPTEVSYEWYRDGKTIQGASGRTYRLLQGDAGATMSVRVHSRFTARWGTTTWWAMSRSTDMIRGTFTTAPKVRVSGTAKVGRTLTAKTSASTPKASKVSYQWLRSGKKIRGATRAKYKLTSSDRKKKISVKVTASRSHYISRSVTSSSVKVATGTFSKASKPKIRGTVKVGKKIRAVPGTWSPKPSLRYRWYRNGKAISKAKKSTYQVVRTDRGKRISVKVTGVRSGYKTRSVVSSSARAR